MLGKRRRVAAGTVIVVALSFAGLAAAQGRTRNDFRIPLVKPGPGVPVDAPGARGNPNDVPSRVVVPDALRGRFVFRDSLSGGSPGSLISGTEALALAWQVLGPAASPTAATATLSVEPTNADGPNTPVWNVVYQGVCFQIPPIPLAAAGESLVPQPSYSMPACTTGEITLDAYSGAFVQAS